LRLLLRRKILNRGFYKKCPHCEDGIIDESDEGVLIMAD